MAQPIRQLTLYGAAKALVLSTMLLVAGAGEARAANAVIISAPGYAYPAVITNLTTLLQAGSYTVSSVTSVPADLSPYAQVWDVRIDTGILPAEATIFSTYLASGGSLFLMGENAFFAARDNSMMSLVSSLGGGTLGPVTTSFAAQTIRDPFTGPNAVSTIAWQASGRIPTAGTGSFISTEASGGSSLVFDPGSLSGAPNGALIMVFDINFLLGPATPNETALAKNLIAYLAAPVVVTPPATPPAAGAPTAFPPTITSIPNQVVMVGASPTLSFSVAGAVIFDALRVSASASNTTYVPTLTLNRLDHDGHWTITVTTADGRAGSAVITITVSDSSRQASTSFMISTSPSLPSAPGNLVASPSGSGIALTWSQPNTGPSHYVVSMGRISGGSDVSVFVTPDTSTNYVLSMVPPGTYYFRVQAVADALSLPSNEATVSAAGSSTVAGVPTGLLSTVNGSNVTVSWDPPPGPAPSLYLVEFGSAPGASDVAIVTSVAATHTRSLGAGFSYVRVRSFNGGAPSAASNETSIPVSGGGCSTAPIAPVLLPVVKAGRVATFSWLPPASAAFDTGTVADSHRLDLVAASGTVTSATVGAGTSGSLAGLAGTYRVRVTASNRCGGSAPSNEISVTLP